MLAPQPASGRKAGLSSEGALMSTPRLVVWMFPAIAAAIAADTAGAQGYPNRPVRFLTTGIGGSTDLAARTVAQGLTDSVGWSVIVDNRGSTIVASDMVAKAPPDGYTITVMTDGL